ncbi:hypothetical protein ACHAXR_007839 [Thalassiosira sp. AJA248-18]
MKVTILYGSATGNAEHIAKDLASTINESKCTPPTAFRSADVMEMNHFKRKKLMESWVNPPLSTDTGNDDAVEKHALIIVCSTTGNGDAPENAGRFVRYLKKPPPSTLSSLNASLSNSAMPLENVAYAVLGLGDTNYDQFCGSAKLVDKKMKEWGATRAVKLACADEATGLEATVEPWLEGVLGGLERACKGGDEEEKKGDEEEKKEENGNTEKQMENLAVSDKDNVVAKNEDDTKTDIPPSTTPSTETTAASSSTTESTASTPTSGPVKSSTPLYILYGSATGNAEHIAKDLCSTYESYLKNPAFQGFFPSVVCCELNQYKKKCLDQWSQKQDGNAKHGVIIVSSTTGNADAPENADRFIRWMKRKATEPTQPFQHCAYAVLGLGDTNYDVFCAVGKAIDKRLEQLGGTRAIKAALADEATGLEETVEPWVGQVIGKLAQVCEGKQAAGNESAKPDIVEPSVASPATGVVPTAASVPKKLKEQSSSSSSVEEKKMDIEEMTASIATTPGSVGVSTIRKLLSIPTNSSLPTVQHSSLPTMVSSLSSCELINDETRRSRGDSIADNMTVSSGSSGFLYTAAKPYESRVMGARYLTATDKESAKKVANEILGEDYDEDDDKIIQAMKVYDEHFPLSSTTSGAESNEKLQYDKNGKRVIEMTLSLPDDFTLEYEPGDSVGLIVPNTPQSTGFMLSMLERNHGILPSQKISVDAAHPITVKEAIQSTIDLCSPMKKKRLFLLSMYATDPEEEQALRLVSSASNGKEGQEVDLFQSYVEDQCRTVVDILKEFPSCQSITLEGLLGCLPAIPPRYYSVCSSPLHDRQSGEDDFHLKVAFSVVDYLTPSLPEDVSSGRRMGGLATRRLECVCSPFLSSQASMSVSKPTVQIFPKPTHEFRLPPNMSTPLILIGPGTGIAPFIGFLSHRQAQMASLESTEAAEMTSEGTWRGGYELDPNELAISKGDARGLNLAVDYMSKHQQVGEIDLFFGCRHSDHDYLYQQELEKFKADGILTNLYAAFSRDDKEKKMYVQTFMKNDTQCGKRLVEMIMEKQASVYICGDGNVMGRDVQEAIVSLLAKHFCDEDKCKDVEEGRVRAMAHVDQMKTFGRFVLDIWS